MNNNQPDLSLLATETLDLGEGMTQTDNMIANLGENEDEANTQNNNKRPRYETPGSPSGEVPASPDSAMAEEEEDLTRTAPSTPVGFMNG